jgi:hypothetical protein
MRRAALAAILALGATGCGPECGDGVVEDGEACEGAPRECETACGTVGSQACDAMSCQLGACVPPAEVCDAVDQNCDGRADETFACAAGAILECTTSCGSTGHQRCEEACVLGACEPPAERCDNGVDDDCDGVIDRLGALESFVVVEGASLSVPPALAAGASGVAIVWSGSDGGYAMRRLGDPGLGGPALGPMSVLVPPAGDRVLPYGSAAGANGTGAVVAYEIQATWGHPGIWLQREGSLATAPVVDNALGFVSAPAIAVSGDAIGLSFLRLESFRRAVYFTVVGPSGPGESHRISPGGTETYEPSAAASATGYGIAFSDDRHGPWRQEGAVMVGNTEIYFARVGTDGAPVGAEVRISDADGLSGAPSLVWNGSRFGVAWVDRRTGFGAIHFAVIDADGAIATPDVRLAGGPDALSPSLSWNGEEWGVAWAAGPEGREQIHFARIDASGHRIGEPARITTVPRERRSPRAVFGGSWILAWAEPTSGSATIHAARVGCE